MEWLSQLYVRRGRWYVWVCGAVGAADLLLILTPFTTVVTARYMGLSAEQAPVKRTESSPLNFPGLM